jgi:hypothetical protein
VSPVLAVLLPVSIIDQAMALLGSTLEMVPDKPRRKIMTNQNQKPVNTFRDGAVKITLWRNQSSEGETYYSAQCLRTYTDGEGNIKDTNSFSSSDLLKLCLLAPKVYEDIRNQMCNVKPDST